MLEHSVVLGIRTQTVLKTTSVQTEKQKQKGGHIRTNLNVNGQMQRYRRLHLRAIQIGYVVSQNTIKRLK